MEEGSGAREMRLGRACDNRLTHRCPLNFYLRTLTDSRLVDSVLLLSGLHSPPAGHFLQHRLSLPWPCHVLPRPVTPAGDLLVEPHDAATEAGNCFDVLAPMHWSRWHHAWHLHSMPRPDRHHCQTCNMLLTGIRLQAEDSKQGLALCAHTCSSL